MSTRTLTFVTGNPDKAKEMEYQLGTSVKQYALDLYEVQSLDMKEVLEAKAREAYRHVQAPVIVDDSGLQFTEMNGLPGPLVKWFMKSVGNEGLCKLANLTETRDAVAEVGIGYCNGEEFEAFIVQKKGTIADTPRGTTGYGWDAIFIPEGTDRTRGELTEIEYQEASFRKPLLDALKTHLESK